jgi:hypothetical protein
MGVFAILPFLLFVKEYHYISTLKQEPTLPFRKQWRHYGIRNKG